MTPLGRHIIYGIGIASGGAFFWALLFSLLDVVRGGEPWSTVVWFPLIGLFYASWLVVPLGATLGIFLPCVASRFELRVTLATGCVIGAGVGALVAYLVAKFIWQLPYWRYAATMIPFCSAWLAGWVCALRRMQTPQRAG